MLLTAAYAARNLDLHGLFRKAELGRDRLLRDAAEFAQDEYFTTTGRQRIDGGCQQNDFITYAGSLSGPRPSIIYDGQGRQICYAIDGRNEISSGRIDHDVPRHLEQQGLRIQDGLRHADLPEPKKRLLHHIVDIRREGKPGVQIRTQRRFVHLHLFGEPPVLLSCREMTWRRRIQDEEGKNCIEASASAGGRGKAKVGNRQTRTERISPLPRCPMSCACARCRCIATAGIP